MWLAYSSIKFVVKMHFKDAKEAVQQKETLFFKVYSPNSNKLYAMTSPYTCDYDVTGQDLTDWPETLSWLAVTNTG